MTKGSLGGSWLVCLWLLTGFGCGSTKAPLDLTTLDPRQDQWQIAAHYSHEAVALRQKAEELTARAAIYERVFGPRTEWVTSATLLAQFYEEVAREVERQAGVHVGIVGGRPRSQSSVASPR